MKVLRMLRVKKDSCSSSLESNASSSLSAQTTFSGITPLRDMNLEEEFKIIKTLAEGSFAKILLVKKGSEKMVLKAIQTDVSSEEDFLREVHTNYFLSPHPNIITSFNVYFLWHNSFVFVQEYAPFGDLSRFVKKGGLPESQVKLIAHQLGNALQFMHSFNLVHRDLKLENILVFKSNFSCIKLGDFGSTRTEGTLVRKTSETWVPFMPPETSCLVLQETYTASKAQDVWQLGILLYVCLKGTTPWQVADITDNSFCTYTDWLRKRSFRLPEAFKTFTPRLIRLFKRILEPKPGLRYEIREVPKYLRDDWLNKRVGTMTQNLGVLDRKESARTSRSSNTSRRQKTSKTLQNYGLDTQVDKELITERVDSWIKSNKRGFSSNNGSI